MALDNSKIAQETFYLMKKGREAFYKAEDYSDKEAGLLDFAKGLKKYELWISRESDQGRLATLKSQFNSAVDEYEKMRNILEGKLLPATSTGGQAMKTRGGKDNDDKDKEKLNQQVMDAIVKEKPNVKWDDIAGLEAAKKALQEAVILPIKFPNFFDGVRTPWKGILLYGPPGTGKTYLAKACATECDGTFFSVSSADLISKFVGESEKTIKSLFAAAREKAPSIIFIDEIDSLCGTRSDNENEASRRVKTEFLVQMQGVGNKSDGILVLGATNIPWGLDSAIRRRFERRIYIPLPDKSARLFLLQHSMKKTKHSITETEFDLLAEKTDGFSGADLSILVRDAAFMPVRLCQSAKYFLKIQDGNAIKYRPIDDGDVSKCNPNQIIKASLTDLKSDELIVPDVAINDFLKSLERTKPSVGQSQLGEFVKWTQEFGQEG